MDKNLKELMQISVISENIELTKMIEDIVPLKENVNHEFSIIVYKKQNPILKFLKGFRYALSKIGIIKNLNEFELQGIYNKN